MFICRRCKGDDVAVSATNPVVKSSGWHNSSTSGAGGYGCSPVFSSLYSSHENSLQDNSAASSSRTDRHTMYDSTGLYAPRSVVEPPKVGKLPRQLTTSIHMYTYSGLLI